ncbi:thiamine phosphate synthase [Campylobacter ureolyticus]|uniref:thiamine phosphate synthase n=1 Tax=Campylobacter ureolyticus TaxID=827 RepID=UPI0022B43657|nr:thiamine phosphate synthase [Campylobacter ureolyticus]MCZ6133516.1 thiamine phosphate synthase [Campylobacter ureolyticus]
MSNLVVITDLKLCKDDIYKRVFKFLNCGANVVLRAKELSENEYFKFANEVFKTCASFKEQIFIHKYADIAINLNSKNIWLPLNDLFIFKDKLSSFDKIVSSAHSVDEVKKAINLGANILSLSHIYKTNCKKDLVPKGLELIKNVKEFFNGEIYALGGINSLNFKECLNAGASKICTMSAAMKCKNETEFIKSFC